MYDVTFGLPVPSLKMEVAWESNYLLSTPLGNFLGQARLYTL